jgi:hypothetical protein
LTFPWGYLQVIAGDKGEADLGLDRRTCQRLADTVDLIVDPAALVNHVLPWCGVRRGGAVSDPVVGEVAESEHHDAATVPSADRAITCRRRLALNALKH